MEGGRGRERGSREGEREREREGEEMYMYVQPRLSLLTGSVQLAWRCTVQEH